MKLLERLRLVITPRPSAITLGDRATATRQWHLAASLYRSVLDRNPANPPIWVQYGHALKESGNLSEAAIAYRMAIHYKDNDADSRLQLAHVLKLQNKRDEAESAYICAFVLDPSLDEALSELTAFDWSPLQIQSLKKMCQSDGNVRNVDRTEGDARAAASSESDGTSSDDPALVPPSEEDLALIVPFFAPVAGNFNEDTQEFRLPTAAEYLGNRSLWNVVPHYLFDPSWYLSQQPRTLSAEINPFVHFLRAGGYERKAPHPLFAPEYYVAQFKRRATTVSIDHPFVHYLTSGRQRDVPPSPLFAPDWYKQEYLSDLSDDVDPVQHYLLVGYRKGFNPHILFDETWYRARANPDDGMPGLVDYVVRGANKGFDPHPLVIGRFIVAQYNGSAAQSTPLETYLSAAADYDPHPLFSTLHYLSQCPDLGGESPLAHYLKEGWRHGLDPHPFFRSKWYSNLSMRQAERAIGPLLHYETIGRFAGMNPNPFFHANWYKEHVLRGRTDVTAEEHYLTVGFANNLPGREGDSLHSGSLVVLSETPQIDYQAMVRKPTEMNPIPRIGAFVHAFYLDLCEELFRYLNNIPSPCTVFISTDTTEKVDRLERLTGRHLRHPAEIRMLPNRGRDIGPWIVGFADRISEVDIGLHLHTKKSVHREDINTWRQFLLDGLVGTAEVVSAHLKVLSYEKIGASLLPHFKLLQERGEINWGHNFQLVRDLLRLCEIDISDQTPLDFPSGSMFWFKSAALRPLLNLNLRFEMFEPESGAVDGTLAHAIERSFLYVVEAAGYGWVRLSGTSDFVEDSYFDVERFLTDGGFRLLPVGLRRGLVDSFLGELAPFNCVASMIQRPRLTLIVPDLDRSRGYAGLNNAFDLFAEIMGALDGGWDARIMSIWSPPESFLPPEGFQNINLGEFDRPNRSIVCDAGQRSWRLLDLRQNDFFLATAWESAHLISLICGDQSRIFGLPERRFLYFIQDYEAPFQAWSSRYYLADATYKKPDRFVAIINTEMLARFFDEQFGVTGHTYEPGLSPRLAASMRHVNKHKNCLIYYRTHAVRNCYELCEIIVDELVSRDPKYYEGWRFLGMGEGGITQSARSRIEHLGRLSLEEYGMLMSRSAVGLSLMVSPHPSYPPLEMAAAGMLVLTNTYLRKDLSEVHENIYSWESGQISDAVELLDRLCRSFEEDNEIGWRGKNKVDWFFTPTDNMREIAGCLGQELDMAIGRR